jgi:hypothetical protein
MSRSLREAFGYRGCPICHVLDKDEYDFMATLQYQTFVQEKARQGVVSANGYCNFHFHQMARLTSPVVNAVLTRDLIEEEVRKIENETSGIRDEVDCLVCNHITEREDFYLREFNALLGDGLFEKEYESTDGLCRIHLKRILDSLKERELSQRLLKTHLMHLKLLRVELETFVSKIRSTKRDMGDEENSCWVAIEKWVGKRGLKRNLGIHKG